MNFLAKSTKLVDSCFAPFNFPYNESYDGGGAKTQPQNALLIYKKKSCKYRKKTDKPPGLSYEGAAGGGAASDP